MSAKPFVYLASPYTKGCPSINASYHAEIYRRMILDDVVVPYAPLLSHYIPGQEAVPYDRWLESQISVLKRCDALFTFNIFVKHMDDEYECIESFGRDKEVSVAKELRKPVFEDIKRLYQWAMDYQK